MVGMNAVVLDIACLCAAWCGTCTAYEATFAELKAAWPGHRLRWIDIEDEADLVGDIDVETFPTLLVAHAGQVLFAGPVLPRLSDAQRLVEAQLESLAQGHRTPLTLEAGQQAAYAQLARALHGAAR
jgi:thioredoxin 1